MVQALETAAFAWAIESSIVFGQCAKPATNTPSVAKSTGRSFTCASKKKLSSFS